MPSAFSYIIPVLLLIGSNVFMTIAWYGHLKYPDTPLIKTILVSWSIALLEYCLVIPANRYGYGYYNVVQLKTIQEIVTLTVFVGFCVFYLGEKITLQHILGFVFIALGGYLIFSAGK